MTLLLPTPFGRRWPRTPITTSGGGPATCAGPVTISGPRCSSWAARSMPRIATGRGISTGPWCGRARRHRVTWSWARGPGAAWRRPQARGFDFGEDASGRILHGAFRGAVLRLPPLGQRRYGRSAAARGGLPRATTAGMLSAAGRPPGPADDFVPRRRRPPHDPRSPRPETLRRVPICPIRPTPCHTTKLPASGGPKYMVADQRFPRGPQGRADVRIRTSCGGYDPRRPGRCRPGSGCYRPGCRFRGEADRPFPRRRRRGRDADARAGRRRARPLPPTVSHARKPLLRANPSAVPLRMPDIAHTFRAGHRIMVQVQSSWFPLAERSPSNSWTCGAARLWISCPAG